MTHADAISALKFVILGIAEQMTKLQACEYASVKIEQKLDLRQSPVERNKSREKVSSFLCSVDIRETQQFYPNIGVQGLDANVSIPCKISA